MTETEIFLIIAAAAVIAFFFWRSRREVKRIRNQKLGAEKRKLSRDVLDDGNVGEPPVERKDPSLGTEPTLGPAEGEPEETDVPQARPPVYDKIASDRKKEAEREAAEDVSGRMRTAAREKPPVDLGIEWVLDITPSDGSTLSIGAIQSLVQQLRSIGTKLPVKLWCKSKADGLYYPGHLVPCDATHAVATLALANRAAVLDEETASRFYQAMEQAAAQCVTDVRTSCDMADALKNAKQIAAFVKYYDKTIEVIIRPARKEVVLTPEIVGAAAKDAGFRHASGRWEYYSDPSASEPLMALGYGPKADGTLRLALDVPLVNLARGDLKKFFSMANHLANRLSCVWVDFGMNPIDAAGAMMIQQDIEKKAAQMAASGVHSGSDRARTLFSRSAG
jgi:hypothetical protein